MALVTKGERQRLLVQLIEEHDIHSQEDARHLLAENGIDTTQATVSRDLDDIGAVKVRGAAGSLVYRLTTDPEPEAARARLAATLHQFVSRFASSGNLAVLTTPPAGAGPVARAIDQADLPGVLATVAGDDTVVVVAWEGIPGSEVVGRLRTLAGDADTAR